MAVVNKVSTEIARIDATPAKMADLALYGGRVRKKVAVIPIAADDSNDSTYRVCRIHSSWHIHSVRILNSAMTGSTDWDLGIYETAENGGDAVDADVYADGVTMASARTAWFEMAFENRALADGEQKVWADAGLTADPGKPFDLVLTANAVGSAAGTILAVVEYTDGT